MFFPLYILAGLLGIGGAGALAWKLIASDDDDERDLNEKAVPRKAPPTSPSAAMSATRHREAKEILRSAWGKSFPGEEPTPAAIQILAAIGVLEGSYGLGAFKNKQTGTSEVINNWGAIQGKSTDAASGKTGGFLASDYDPINDKWYEAHYQRYATPADGAAALIRLVERYAPEAIRKGHILQVSKQMYTGERRTEGKSSIEAPQGYYQGMVPPAANTPEARITAAWENIRRHADKTFKEAHAFATANGEPLAAYLEDLDWYLGNGMVQAGAKSSTATASKSSPSGPAYKPPVSKEPSGDRAPASGRMLALVKAGKVLPPTWVPVTVGGYRLMVTSDGLRSSEDGVRYPVSFAEAIEIAKILDAIVPTLEMSDAIWTQADVKIAPVALPPTSHMGSVAWSITHSNEIDKQLKEAGAKEGALVADVGKDWILSSRLKEKPGMGVNYGWRDKKTGRPAQPEGATHNEKHSDYSQVQRYVRIEGERVDSGAIVDLRETLNTQSGGAFEPWLKRLA